MIRHAASGSPADIGLEGAVARCTGAFTVGCLAALEQKLSRQSWPEAAEIVVDGAGLSALDTAGVVLLRRTVAALERDGRRVVLRGFRPEHETILALVASAPRDEARAGQAPRPPLLARVGEAAWRGAGEATRLLAFVGEVAAAGLRTLRHPGRVRWRPVLYNVRTAGFDALPITGLLCFLMGIVISYQGATQLERYGANIFVADLVGLAMLRELSPLLTAIIVAGRSGSAYAAQIGTMKVTDEVDALRTVGIPPIELLVLPKILALSIALPLLTVYADVLGVAGGMVMARSELDVGYADFLDRLQRALRLSDFLVGIGKAPVFAGIIAVIGCYQGFQVSGDAESVGRRTTVSVVQSIFLVIVTDAFFSVAFNSLGL